MVCQIYQMNGIYTFARMKYKECKQTKFKRIKWSKEEVTIKENIQAISKINIITTEELKVYFRTFNISTKEIALNAIEFCEEIFEYRNIFIYETKILMSGKTISVVFIEEKAALKVTNHKKQYFIYSNSEKGQIQR
jgi:hypothetical protein